MAGAMHVMISRPSCWTAGDPTTLEPRVGWAWDCAAACANFATLDDALRALEHTKGCAYPEPCSRALRSRLIREGKVQPHGRRTGRRVSPVDAVSRPLDESGAASVVCPATSHAEASESASGGEIFTSEVAA